MLCAVALAAGCSADRSGDPRADRRPDRPDRPDRSATTPARPGGSDLEDPPAPGRLTGRRICLDPGHESYWIIGTSARDRSGGIPEHPTEGIPLHEHLLNLKVAYRLATLLEAEGAAVCVTRTPDGDLQIQPYDYTGDGLVRPGGVAEEDVGERVQPRIDWANAFGAELLLSIHFNGNDDPSVSGTEVYLPDASPRLEKARRLGEAIMDAVIADLTAAGHSARSRGIMDRYAARPPELRARLLRHYDAIIRSHGVDPADCPQCDGLLPLGNNPFALHLGNYVAALVEVEYMTNPDVVESLLLRPDVVDIVARALARGILAYYGYTA